MRGFMSLHTIQVNLQYPEGIRREVFEGVEHLVVPVVMIVDGVLNGALVTQEEYGRHVSAWNGIPVPVLHPESDGIPISANSPDVIEKNTIGRIFNATAEGGKLKAEAWINTDKAKRLGYTALLDDLAAGEVLEVSTGYYPDVETVSGVFNGAEYSEIHRNIRPDHLALLPGEIGACSVQDGCGTRVNQRRGSIAMKVNEALTTLASALGLRSNCDCEEDPMDLMKQAEALRNNGSLTAKQYQMITDMDEDARTMLRALLDAMGSVSATAEDKDEAEEMSEQSTETAVAAQSQQPQGEAPKTFTAKDVEHIVANQLRRAKVMDKLAANSACAFDESDLQTMTVEQLEKYEKSIRPTDYSGAGGFATNSDAIDTNVTPLLPRKAFSKAKEA